LSPRKLLPCLTTTRHLVKGQIPGTPIIDMRHREGGYINALKKVRWGHKIIEEIRIRNDDPAQKSPIIVMFTWGFASNKNISRYREMLAEQNYTVVTVRSSYSERWGDRLLQFDKNLAESDKVWEVVAELCTKSPDRPIILFPFSYAGCLTYSYFTRDLNSTSSPGTNIKGVIFDSCPIVPTMASIKRIHSYRAVQTQSPWYRLISWPFMKLNAFLLLTWNQETLKYKERINESRLTCPQLVLCSEKDDIAMYEEIEQFIDTRNKNGVDISYKAWTDSLHLQHHKMYENEYRDTVLSFISKCLNENE